MALTPRTRKRLLIAMVVGVGGGAWWLLRPQVDQRYVGDWKWSSATGGYRWNIHLDRDGSGSMSDGDIKAGRRTIPIRWRIANGDLVCDPVLPFDRRGVETLIHRTVQRFTGRPLYGSWVFSIPGALVKVDAPGQRFMDAP
jgi:hypothetical protein